MADDQIDALLALAPPPVRPDWHQPPTSDDWAEMESHFGFEFPADYKRLIECYGTGQFGEFVLIMNPFCVNKYISQRLVMKHNYFWTGADHDPVPPTSSDPDYLRIWNQLRAHEKAARAACPYDFYPTHPGLFPWGIVSDNEAWTFWLTEGDPNHWPVVVYYYHDAPIYERRPEVGCCGLLVEWLRGNVRPEGWPPPTRNKDGQYFTSARMYDHPRFSADA
jgi:hypothetical protein